MKHTIWLFDFKCENKILVQLGAGRHSIEHLNCAADKPKTTLQAFFTSLST